MQKYLLDTNTIIYALNNSFKFPSNIYLVSEIELLSYANLSDVDAKILKMALSNFQSVELTSDIKELTIQIRKQSKLKLPDSI